MEEVRNPLGRLFRIKVALAFSIALAAIGVPAWTFYKQSVAKREILTHVDRFLRQWNLPAPSTFQEIAVRAPERNFPDRTTVVLSNGPNKQVVLWHRPTYPFIVHADADELGLPKATGPLEAKDWRKVLIDCLGKEAFSTTSLTAEPFVSDASRDPHAVPQLVVPFSSEQGRISTVARFSTESGQLRSISVRAR